MNKKELYNILLNDHHFTEKIFKNKYYVFYEDFCKTNFPKEFSFRQKLYHWLNDDFEFKLGLCDCGNRCKFESLNIGYKHHCSKRCSTLAKDVKEKRKTTCLEKYGVEHESKCDEVLEKRKKTCRENYGVDWPSQSKEVIKKRNQNNLKKYGVECTLCHEDAKEKSKETLFKNYSVDHPSKSKEIQNKKINTSQHHYGVDYPFQSNEIKEKIKHTLVENYGVDNPMKSKEISEKTKKTNLERYGGTGFASEELAQKYRKTVYKLYGVTHPSRSPYVLNKTKQTTFEHYGVEVPVQNEEVKAKMVKTNLKKYGVPYACMLSKNHSNNSKPNIKFAELLDENNIEYEREFVLEKYIYDFKINNVFIEINPTITHNSQFSIFHRDPVSMEYHKNKSIVANNHGYKCIHVWDWDDEHKVINFLKPKQTLYARNLVLQEIQIDICDEFLNTYHFQNTCNGQIVRLGLVLNSELVQIMTFGKPRYNTKYEWELLRLCTHANYKIVGGAEKLFSFFVKHFNPKTIISYCDHSKFNGEIYKTLSFKLKNYAIGKHWVNYKSKSNLFHITDNLLRQRGFDQLFGTNYGKGTSNEQLILDEGFLPVYDAGQYTFVWEN